ncbi:uncharacterized protein ATC70_001561 [Mucor velutinosus]|uniref:PiggyBac transposable element-derived protein domain-containing protein n=1 Tax=Mucor velutinosus TaxID=708070 RepID=A0AAN7HNZ7_9FUNG|nr:hypothetical protein ATC70_001561 [Mucor velutinosus]
MPMCISPGKYLVIDESMNQWLGIGMPNIKKVPGKPHPIGQEFKTLADCHTSCILRMDTVSDPVSKEFDDEPGMKKLTATVNKRSVQPWSGSGRTVIADSWFGSSDMVKMLSNLACSLSCKCASAATGLVECLKQTLWKRLKKPMVAATP